MGREIQKVIVDRAYRAGAFDTYADLAAKLKISRATLSQWRSGTHPIPDKRLEQLCKISGDDMGVVALAIMAETTNIRTLRDSINGILHKAGAAFSIGLVVLMFPADDARANAPENTPHEMHYAKLCRWLRALAAAVRTVGRSLTHGASPHDATALLA